MSAPRILINALSLSIGGGRSYVTNLLRELTQDDRGFRFTVLARPGQLAGMETRGLDVEEVAIPDRPRVLWRVAYEELAMPLAARRFDLLYCLADLAPRFARAPVVVLLRNLLIYDRRWYDDLRMRTLARLVQWGLPNARRVLFPSRAAAEQISALVHVPAERVRVVPYGISLDAFAHGEAAAPAGTKYLFLPAAVERHKNIEVLVDGLARTADRELELWVAGHSPLDPGHRELLMRRAQAAGVDRRVRFLGAVPYRDVLRYYRDATAFVFPSFLETFGHPLLEAMVVGTPAVVSDIPTFREIAGDAALYFPPGDPDALARALDSVQRDPASARLRVESGRKRAARFSWRASVDGLCAVFDEVLAERKRGRRSASGDARSATAGSA